MEKCPKCGLYKASEMRKSKGFFILALTLSLLGLLVPPLIFIGVIAMLLGVSIEIVQYFKPDPGPRTYYCMNCQHKFTQ